jgi:hypothetical protein
MGIGLLRFWSERGLMYADVCASAPSFALIAAQSIIGDDFDLSKRQQIKATMREGNPMADAHAGRPAAPIRELKMDQGAPASSTQPPEGPSDPQSKSGDPNVRGHLEKGISELQNLHKMLLSSEVDPKILSDFRDALNRVRNTAWAAQQYVIEKENGQDSTSVHSLLAGERIRAAYQLGQALTDDLKRNDIKFQRGSLAQLQEITKALTDQLKSVIDKL